MRARLLPMVKIKIRKVGHRDWEARMSGPAFDHPRGGRLVAVAHTHDQIIAALDQHFWLADPLA